MPLFAALMLSSAAAAFGQAPPAPPSAQPASPPPPAPAAPSPTPSGYADRAAPLLPAVAGDGDRPIDLAPAALGPPASPPCTGPGLDGSTDLHFRPDPGNASAEASKGEWIIAPLPNYVPAFGLGIVARVGYIFPLDPDDKVSPPSVVGAAGYVSENSSWAGGMGGKLYFDEDRNRVTAFVARGDLNYNFSGIGIDNGRRNFAIPLKQQMSGGMLEWLFKAGSNFYIGPKYIGAKLDIGVNPEDFNRPTAPLDRERSSTFSGIGVHAQWDTRDSQFYPRKGILADAEVVLHDPTWGDSFSYQVYTLSFNQYISLDTNQVLAWRIMGQFETGDVPFYALSQFGRGSDLRGFELGRYQDKQMFAAQAEYRYELSARWAVAAFAGVGSVAPHITDFNLDDLLPSAGFGLRYVVAPKNHVSIRFDVAWGRNGGGPQFYLSVGEAF